MSQAIVERACAKLRSAIGDEAVVRSNFTRDLRDMLKALEAIQPVLDKAEIRSLMDISASQWLELVRAVAYKIIDMVDELQEARSPATTTMTSMLPRLAIMKNAMAIQVQETKRQVMRIQEQGLTIGSDEGVARNKQATGPVYEEAMVSGRDLDKERTIALLLLSAEGNIKQEHITILPIFGLAGSGKTTLAQMVFNDTHSLQGYDFRVWVHVSPQLDLHTLCESIIHQVTRAGGGQEDGGMDYIMKRLHELLNGKKVLLVLDDLWEQDPIQLQLLKSMLIFMGNKVDIIVTTCNQAIARKICTVEPYKLNPLTLGHEGCEIIRKSIHLLKEEKQEKREKIGWEMPTWCPWEKLGRVLSFDFSRHNSVDSTFSLPLPTLEISYQSMPPDLRLCCAYYCTIFHKGHNIVKDDLVHQWIALHLIEPSETLSATQIADEYITKLLDLSFLQTAKSDPASGKDDKGAILFTMHDLVHDFVNTFLPSYTYYVTNPHMKPDDEYDKYLRALRCVSCSKVEFNDNSFSRKKCLRVLELKESSMQKLPDSICQLRQLGYLKISEFTGLVTLPESFGHLKNLFHIDLSGCSRLAGLPESFGYLINLTHVNLSRCHGLAKLPEQLQKLGKLAHLNLSFWSCFEGIGKGLGGLTTLEHLNLSNPFCHLAQQRSHLQGLKDGLCKLTKLRYLNLSMCLNPIFYIHQSQEDSLQYIAECVEGLSILEHLDLSHNTFLSDLPQSLGDLNRLHTLDLSGCIRIKKVGETKCLKIIIDLSKCRGLESCQFVVRVDEAAYRSTSNLAQLEVVDCKELEISCLERLQCLEEARRIRLVQKQKVERLKLCWTVGEARGCMKVDENALLGELVPPHSLRCLEICGYGGETCLPAWRIPSISSHLPNLTEVTMEDFPRCIELPPLGLFPNLQRLVLRRMARITRIDAGELSGGNREAFTRLSKFTIDDMENLKEFEFADVDELAIQKCPLLSFGSLPPRAHRLLISDSDQVMSSSIGGVDGVERPSAQVTELVVESCNVPLGDWTLLHHLHGLCSLTINNCYNLTSSPEITRALSSLQELAIDECHGIQSLPEDMLAKLTGLKALYIWDCPELKKWCESEENKQKLAHIQVKFEKFDTSKTGAHPPEI